MSQSSGFDLNKLSTADKLVFGGAIAYLIWVFIPGWYSLEGFTASGFRFPMVLAWLLAIVAIAELVTRKFANMNLNLPWKPGMIHLVAGVAALVLTLLGLLIRPGGFGISFGVSWALFVGIVIAGVWAYGGYMMYSEPANAGATGGGGMPPAPGGGGFTS
jgi:hypothetical protein